MGLKKIIKRILPGSIIAAYHYCLAVLATFIFGFPAKKMVVIALVGTKGKTSTANFIWACLTAGGEKTGIISTANIRVGEEETLNKYHMTMPGRFVLQGLLSKMVKAGCKYCVVEATSEGIKQYRYIGLYCDIAVFTNLFPEHLQSHEGSFEKYKQAKGKLFASLLSRRKVLRGDREIEKIIIANKDSEHSDYFLSFPADKKISFSVSKEADFIAENIQETSEGASFEVADKRFQLFIPGRFNVSNALPAIIISKIFNISDEAAIRGLARLKTIPGRMEKIDQSQDFLVFVDYAHEKQGLINILQTAKNIKQDGAKIIVLLGAEGGGRDKTKRPQMGEVSAKMADLVVVSNVDPYEDDPRQILEDIVVAAEKNGKVRGRDLFVVEDRREGIRKALSLAQKNDIVLITGKGAEQSIVIGGRKAPWDDRIVVKEELKKLIS